jgi:hypothetical protein
MSKGYVRHRPERHVEEATEAQIRAMNEKLETRAKHIFNVQQAVQSPKEKSALEWEKPVTGADGVYTKCRTYACAKGLVMGKMLYSLSKRLPIGTYTPINCRLDSFMQAKELARQDWEKSQ